MADTNYNDTDDTTRTKATKPGEEPATTHDVTEGGILGAVGGAIVGGLAGGPIGAVIGAVVGGAASAGAVDVVDKHDHDYARTAGATDNTATTDRTGYTDTTTDRTGYTDTTTDRTGYTDTTTDRTGYAAAPATMNTGRTDTGTINTNGETVIPIVEEELQVGKRQVQGGGARIHTDVIETPVDQAVQLREEHVTVDRHAANRPVTDADTAFQDQNFNVTETDEVPVVAKTARVVEEVVVGKTATDRTETVHDTVRRTEVDVEEIDGNSRTNR